jgi:hypothetical protein
MKMRSLWLWIPWTLFIAAALGWVVYWHSLAGEAEKRIAAWAAQQSAAGARATYTRIVRHGFPVLLRLEIQDFFYAPARGGWRADTSRVDLHVQVLNPEHVIFEAKAPIAIARADNNVTNLSADALIASLRTERGALAVAGIEADNLVLDDPSADGVLSVRKIVANLRPNPRATGEYQLAFDATALTLPRPVRSFEAFGIEAASLRAAIMIEHGPELLNAAPHDPLGPWREAGGQLRFDALTLNWGPLNATGRGQGGLDAERRLQGALELPIERPGPLFSALANGPRVDENARRALALLAAAYSVSGDDITLDVEARGGVLRLEGLSVRPLPPVY